MQSKGSMKLKEEYKHNQRPKSRDKKVISRYEKVKSLDRVISFSSIFQDRRTEIVAYKGAIFNQMMSCGSLDQRKFVCKNIKVLNQEMKK